jgi:hypothetical protein
MIVLPRFAVGMLLARKLVAADNPHDAMTNVVADPGFWGVFGGRFKSPSIMIEP